MALGEQTEDDETGIQEIYNTTSNIKTGLAPAFESQSRAIEAIDCIPVQGRDGLFLFPGHVGFAEYEVTLGIAQELSGSIQALKNLPGSSARYKLANKLLQQSNKNCCYPYRSTPRGSNTSRRPSPKRLNAKTVNAINSAGAATNQGCNTKIEAFVANDNILPQDGSGC